MIFRMTAIIIIALGLTAGMDFAKTAEAQGIKLQFRNPSFLKIGRKFIQEGKTEEAQNIYLTALKKNLTEKQAAEAHNGLCVAYIMEEIWETALEHCNQAIEIRPNNWRYYNNRGSIYLSTGAFNLAIKEYEYGLKIAPNSQVMQDNLKLALNQQERLDISNGPAESE